MGNLWYNKDVTVVQPAQRDIWEKGQKNEGKFDRTGDMHGTYIVVCWVDMVNSAYTDKFSFRPMARGSNRCSDWNLSHAHRKFHKKEEQRRRVEDSPT